MSGIALALTQAKELERLPANGPLRVADCAGALGWSAPPLPHGVEDEAVTRLHLGSEFCETLLPTETQLAQAAGWAAAAGLGFALLTPSLSDGGLAALAALLPHLPAGTEVVANDWGTLRLLRDHRPDLTPVAGRLLCKMVKDPRLPSAEWARLYPHGVHSGPFGAILERMGVQRIEMDVPPFAEAEDFRSSTARVAVHAPYGFSVKGRACRIGSLAQPPEGKFTAEQKCRRECLVYVGGLSRGDAGTGDLPTFQRGNTVFYRHSPAMIAALSLALAEGWIDRLVLNGDWNENRRPH
ncbi:conserved protein of unknown function [Magnetospirillum sp. XM-1]|uniref:hypothetical protein n=1 Tax=Magnetospirillum sp. XM-1 TaxID=1663591 RepID=UPI00073DC3E0|nr:hypothetical protein [Magnetospirillum sp. XM-1]CUW39593.1 conserved protein of unknown function [Magnetospirillum sp. XM-1]